ncbi:DUF2244 domain-containing protein [Polynucleobacter bastaniensis]|jgi:uncharacterized membrane protein|uniref:DUF2244 domain-containing protein n=1 Tax=Polynucleobacter bastaniensis TaxID=2081039 RepID=UPI001C0D0291|nr:DUF2244 domain-containing protein [Polynucleobacter bastaniensis]MBU3597619.1 DUF2244 domain-containing protein [Polynucleobacter bastaniensis]
MKIWKMRRNCALTPSQLLKFYIALVCLSLTVATGFLLVGVKIILIFTAIELTAVTVGFLVYCRHALDFEEIEISGTRLLVRKFIAYKESVTEFNTHWVRLSHPEEHQKVFFIEQTDQRVEVGQFLRREQLQGLIAELRSYLG